MYSVSVPAGVTAIEISYAGYTAQTIALGVSNTVDIALASGTVLDQAVVVGYGSSKKSDLTGAVGSITEKDFNKGIVTSPEQLMQGRVAGVQVSSNSGEPGGGINVRIRGTSSVRAGNNPLYVIDGVPLSGDEGSGVEDAQGIGRVSGRNPLSFINPDDIASIDILKDASATAIYGSRGANGVVLITTKKGKDGKGTVDYTFSYGLSKITKKYDLLTAAEFAKANEKQDQKKSIDWQDDVFQTGASKNHALSFGGGNADGNYRFSLGYLNQDGIIKESGLDRYTGRFNATQKLLNNRLTLGVSTTVANTVDRTSPISDNAGFVGDLLSAVLKSNPTMDKFAKGDDPLTAEVEKDATILNQPGESEPTPAAILAYYRGRNKTLRGMGNVSAEIQIIEGLKFKTILGFDRSLSSRYDAFSGALKMQSITGKGRLYTTDVNTESKLMENYFTYDKKFGMVGLSALVGYSYQNFDFSGRSTGATAFSTNNLDLMINNSATAGKQVSNSNARFDELQSYFGRANFNIGEKYLLTASIRQDGSTKFGPNNKTGIFPAVAAKWRIGQESFLPKGVFSDLSVRAGWGITGNQEIPHNIYDQRVRTSNLSFNSDGNLTGGALDAVSFAQPGLKWESTAATNFGIDFGVMKNLLLKLKTAQPAPTPFVWDNFAGTVVNKGVELSLNIEPMVGDFKWSVNTNVALNNNKVKDFGAIINTGEINGQGLTGAFAQRIANDQPLFAYFLRPFGGYDAEGNSIYPQGDVQQFLDGKSPLPKVTAGVTNTFSYKGINLSASFNGVFGHYIYSNTANAFFTKGALSNGRNVTKNVVNDPIASKEGKFNAPDVSTRFLEKGDFVRLANLSLSYDVKTGVPSISGLRFFVTGQNLLTFTKYSGQDPEVTTNKALDGVPSFGIDYNAYPRAKTFTVGAKVSF
jgi:TonB-dependent starch-binding outer membrane protein SusC